MTVAVLICIDETEVLIVGVSVLEGWIEIGK